jgi:hypothetical protein
MWLSDDENVKAMRETAQATGLTDLLKEVRRDLVDAINALDQLWARVNKALELLGVADDKDRT